jgi:hypothetical protein
MRKVLRMAQTIYARAKAALWLAAGHIPPAPCVAGFLSGLSIREAAYHYTTGGAWPERVREVEAELRAHTRKLEADVQELERLVRGMRGATGGDL